MFAVEAHDDESVDIPIGDIPIGDERASLLQEQLAILYQCQHLSHASALCKFAFLASQPCLQFNACVPIALALDYLCLLTSAFECCCLSCNCMF